MDVETALACAFVALWAGFVARGFATGRMLMRGGDVVREERPRTYAAVMIGNVTMLCVVVALIALT